MNWLKDTLKAFDDFKNNQRNLWSNIFWYDFVYLEVVKGGVPHCTKNEVFYYGFSIMFSIITENL